MVRRIARMTSITHYKKCLVGYIDILGFKDMVYSSKNCQDKLSLIDGVLESFKQLETKSLWSRDVVDVEEDAQRKDMDLFDLTKNIKCTCFSDSIAISVEVSKNDVNEKASTFIANLSRIGAELLCKGVLIRGAITIGDVVHKRNGVFYGTGLIEAYQLEASTASQPRIIISTNLINQLNYPLNAKRDRYPYHQYLDRYEDGCVGFSQLMFYQVMQNSTIITKGQLADSLLQIRTVIINGLDSHFESPTIFLKYKWLMEEYRKLIIFNDDKKEILDVELPDSRHNIHYAYINQRIRD